MYKKLLMQLLDLPFDWASKECSSKLAETYLLINNELVFVNEISGEGVTFTNNKGVHNFIGSSQDKVESIEVWLPETGVYFKKGSGEAILLQRKPMRQWRRSFSTSFYGISFFEETKFKILDIDVKSRQTIWVDCKGVIRYLDKEIGYIKNSSSIVCTVKHFKQELFDWSRGVIL